MYVERRDEQMNIAIIFAGGVGKRMNNKAKPKQFLELHGKPIIIYTLEAFENNKDIDEIVVVCIQDYIDELKKHISKFGIEKINVIVPGGTSGFASIYNGLSALKSTCNEKDIVLLHDGVRPFVDDEIIAANIAGVKKHGNAITSVPTIEGIMISEDGAFVDQFPERKIMYATKAPQSFRYGEIFDLYKRAKQENFEPIESAHLCQHYGMKLHMVLGSYNNIKITTPMDYYIFRALYEANENSQLIGY